MCVRFDCEDRRTCINHYQQGNAKFRLQFRHYNALKFAHSIGQARSRILRQNPKWHFHARPNPCTYIYCCHRSDLCVLLCCSLLLPMIPMGACKRVLSQSTLTPNPSASLGLLIIATLQSLARSVTRSSNTRISATVLCNRLGSVSPDKLFRAARIALFSWCSSAAQTPSAPQKIQRAA